ncbi:MAG TPA: hypothetical protein VEP72_05735, partial [Microbacterium sp.]|nr:hypothetical protein [Microbacterium sp.]
VAERVTGEVNLQGADTAVPPQQNSGTADRSTTGPAQLAPSTPGDSQQQAHPEHPANAGSKGNGNGPDTKRDQSRNSPDKRD